jgi:outer membrane protein assembly factor BamB
MRTISAGNSRGWLVDHGEPVPVPVLDPPEALLDEDVALTLSGNELVARSVRTGGELWRRTEPEPTHLLAVQPRRVHLLTDAHELITLDSVTGSERSRFPLVWGDEEVVAWRPGITYVANGYVAVERLAVAASPDAGDSQYYAAPQPVILAGT